MILKKDLAIKNKAAKNLALIAGLLLLCGCSHARIYGVSGPGLQDDVYHPTEDPLFKNDN